MSDVAEVPPEVLVAGRRELHVARGDLVFAHVALSKLGHVGGGVEGFIAGMLEAVNPETLLMRFEQRLSIPVCRAELTGDQCP